MRSTKIQEILDNYSSIIVYDEINASVRATVTIQEGQTYPVINGKTLIPGTYIFWYENEKSLSEKLKLVRKYDLKGSGSWSLGQETADTWTYYHQVINGEEQVSDIFDDVPTNHWAYHSIYLAKEKGWILGRREHYFEPEETLTRAEFATLISRILGYQYSNEGNFYLDTKGHWAQNEINAVTMAKLMNGYQNGLFWPNNPITREEVAKVLYFLIDEMETNQEIHYLDVSKERWSYEYIQQLSALGIFNGYENGEFKPQNPIKRSEIVTVLERVFANN